MNEVRLLRCFGNAMQLWVVIQNNRVSDKFPEPQVVINRDGELFNNLSSVWLLEFLAPFPILVS